MPVQQIVIPRWFDRHLHPRDGTMLKNVLPCTLLQQATGAVIMGNLPWPDMTSTIEKAQAFRQRIIDARDSVFFGYDGKSPGIQFGSDFKPRMTCYLTDDISPEEVVRGFKEDVWCGVKLYITSQEGKGGTTGSAHGVKDLLGRYKVFEAMEAVGVPLFGHWEAVEDTVDEFDREAVSLERDLQPILKRFPKLRVVFEHLTDARAADFVADSEYDIRATVTAHHLMLNRNALFEGGMNPIYWCKPAFKRENHRKHVRGYVTSGHPRFGAGTDSAPHDVSNKTKCCGCAAGDFTAPDAVEHYTQVFAEDNALEHLGPFMSENFLDFYGMEPSKETMTIVDVPHAIRDDIGGVKVFPGRPKDGKKTYWTLVSKFDEVAA